MKDSGPTRVGMSRLSDNPLNNNGKEEGIRSQTHSMKGKRGFKVGPPSEKTQSHHLVQNMKGERGCQRTSFPTSRLAMAGQERKQT